VLEIRDRENIRPPTSNARFELPINNSRGPRQQRSLKAEKTSSATRLWCCWNDVTVYAVNDHNPCRDFSSSPSHSVHEAEERLVNRLWSRSLYVAKIQTKYSKVLQNIMGYEGTLAFRAEFARSSRTVKIYALIKRRHAYRIAATAGPTDL